MKFNIVVTKPKCLFFCFKNINDGFSHVLFPIFHFMRSMWKESAKGSFVSIEFSKSK